MGRQSRRPPTPPCPGPGGISAGDTARAWAGHALRDVVSTSGPGVCVPPFHPLKGRVPEFHAQSRRGRGGRGAWSLPGELP